MELIVSDACRGLTESAAGHLPDARWQRCTEHFQRGLFSHVPKTKMREFAHMLKTIHARERRQTATGKAEAVVTGLCAMRLNKAAGLVEEKIQRTD